MTEVRGKRVLVVGLARTGRAVAQCLHRRGAVVTVTDTQPPSAFQNLIPELTAQKIGLELGVQRDELFLRQDLIVVSPGVPWDLPQLRAARENRIPVVPEIEVAGWFLTGRLVGITGTNGKTTTTALLGKMFETSGFPTFVGGNIGVPLISAVDQVSPESVVVAELSSFQLEGIRDFRPHVAVLLNITPNHLDRHASFHEYVRAKAQILSNLRAEDYAILNADDVNVMSLLPAISQRRTVLFSRRQDLPAGICVLDGHIWYRVGYLERVLLETRDVPLRGAFNLENVLAACAAACVLGADFEALRRAVREFKGVEHRLEFVRQIRGVDFYNDSKATSVDAAAKALSAFERGVHLILGGKDKGAPYTPLRPLLASRVRTVYLIGAAAERIARELEGAVELVHARDLQMAVRGAFERATSGDFILLSPACASFDQFQDYEHRGQVFKQIVEELAQEVELEEAGQGGREKPRQGAGSPSGSGPQVKSQSKSNRPVRGAQPSTQRPPVGQNSPRNSAQALPASKAGEPIYAYEVGAEEFAAAEDIEAQADWAEDEFPAEALRLPEAVEDESLPFEVRAATGWRAKSVGSPRASGSVKAETERESPRRGPKSQNRLPGI